MGRGGEGRKGGVVSVAIALYKGRKKKKNSNIFQWEVFEMGGVRMSAEPPHK